MLRTGTLKQATHWADKEHSSKHSSMPQLPRKLIILDREMYGRRNEVSTEVNGLAHGRL